MKALRASRGLSRCSGAQLPAATLDGVSFAPRLLQGANENARKWAYAEGRGGYWVRERRYKITSRGEIFDLLRNPDELPDEDIEKAPGLADTLNMLRQAIQDVGPQRP